MAAPGHEVAVTPLIGKLRLHIQGYVGHEEFYIMPLEGCDVLLGMPWFYNHKAVLDSFNKTVTLEIRSRKIVLDVKLKGESVPLVSASVVPRLMKQHISAYLIYVKERDETESSNLSSLDVSRRAFLDEYADCFSEALSGQLPPECPEDHNIDLIPSSAAPNKPPYRVRAAQQEEIMTQALNKITVKNKFPIPRIDDVLDCLQGASFFNRIDLKSGYHQIRVNPADVPKTAFRTTFGLYEFLVMPFGLTNAPATFNRMMDRIFRPLHHCVGTFFDDMILFSEHLHAVFEMLRKGRLVVNGKKSEFFMEEIHFLGHIVSKDGVRMDPPEMTAQIYEKELLAVIHALTQWRHYLLGADFSVFTDHQNLRYFLSQKQFSEKQMQWANILSQPHFQIVHVQGQKNVVADALSQRPLVRAISAIHHSSFEDMVHQYATVTDFADIFTRIRDGETVAGYSIREGYLMRKTMLCVTQPLTEKVMIECHCPLFTGHRGIATTMKGVEILLWAETQEGCGVAVLVIVPPAD
ncbi:hypothetical protein L7F22_028482 [Adiantum nelumboides]|nr:hypothetical protein [Adiantum nelumboides]